MTVKVERCFCCVTGRISEASKLLSEICIGNALSVHYLHNTKGEMLSSQTAFLDTEVRHDTNPGQSLSEHHSNAPLLRAESIGNFSQRKL